MTHKFAYIFLLGIAILSLSAFVEKDKKGPERPIDNWVFTANLDGQPNVLLVALHKNLWVAYDKASCQLIKAWRGGVKIEGEDASLEGLLFYQEEARTEKAWKVIYKGEEVVPEAEMERISLKDNTLLLDYILTLPDGKKIELEERPEVIVKSNDNRCGLERSLDIKSLPPDTEVLIPLTYEGMLKKRDLRSNKKIHRLRHEKRLFNFGTVHDMEVEAELDPKKTTKIKMMYTVDMEQASGG